MGLLGEVGRTADDVVLSIFNLVDECRTFLIQYDLDTVAHRNRICTPDTFEPEVPLYLTFDKLPVISSYLIPTPGILYY